MSYKLKKYDQSIVTTKVPLTVSFNVPCFQKIIEYIFRDHKNWQIFF